MLSKLKIDKRSLVHLSLAVVYNSEYGQHRDVLHFEKFNVWRDIDLLPAEMQGELLGKESGYKQSFSFMPGQLLEANTTSLLHRIRNQDFNRQPRKNLSLEPRLGRYYPKGWFVGVPGVFSDNMSPGRLVELDSDHITADFNHPLSDRELSIEIEVFNVTNQFDEHGGRCNDCLEDLLKGPGMQCRYQHQATDFFSDDPFKRSDEAQDGLFYSMPRMLNHLDDTALSQLQDLHGHLLTNNAHILDLMSSINSHLPKELTTAQVTGLGMNAQELEANPRLDQHIIHDLNQQAKLPFDDHSFDVVLCTVSVEYLNQPMDIFREAARVLKPGGLFINSFSNRWFPTKAIRLWGDLHEFERMGLVSEYFIRSARFENINTWSIRGLPRPENDRHSLPLSDPVYAVWGTKT